jgi:ADP-glucose type glycogen/starch synthase
MSTSPSIPLVPTKSDEELLESASPVKVLTTPDSSPSRPKILVVTPEITYLPHRIVENQYAISQYSALGDQAVNYSSKAGGLADVSASLVSALYDMGADVHIALPFYRRIYHIDPDKLDHYEKRRAKLTSQMPEERVHFAKDYIFNYRERVYSADPNRSVHISLAFQREVINHTIPELQPDLVHCNDWMTGLIPAFARRMHIPSLFTVHNIHTQKTTLDVIEDAGIDTGTFWQNLYFERQPTNYEETRSGNQVDLMTSGIFGAHFINTVSPTFLREIVNGQHDYVPDNIRREMTNKFNAGCTRGILNAPDPDYNPATDTALEAKYSAADHVSKKRINKIAFQKQTGLIEDPDAPLFFWPSRLDPIQKGPQLLATILYDIIHEYWPKNLQVAIVADGAYQRNFHDILSQFNLHGHLCVCNFSEKLSRLGYAASDFVLMPSRFEPCGLPQMIGPIYGSLPIVHDTGGLHDTVTHMDAAHNQGNGFVFKFYDSQGLRWAIDQAMAFHELLPHVRDAQVLRVMTEASRQFTHEVTAENYIKLYEQMLQRPLIVDESNAKPIL